MTRTDTVVSEERLREILDGCEGVTPGPWRVGKHPSGFQLCGDGMWFMTAGWTVKDARNQPDAAHIARLDPATVASMARELLDRRTATTPQSGGVVALPAWNDLPEAVRSEGVEEGMIWVSHVGADAALSIYNAMRDAIPRSTLADPIPEAPADEEVEAELRRQADAAYIRYINLMGTKPCLGVEAKLASGEFGAANLDAHREASEALGRHRGINAAIDILRALRRPTETDKPGVREALQDLIDAWDSVDGSGGRYRGNVTRAVAAARLALSASPLTEEQPVAEGWKLVPVEPVPEMLAAWYRYKSGVRFPDEEPARDTSDYGAYRAMIAAAPLPRSTTGGAK